MKVSSVEGSLVQEESSLSGGLCEKERKSGRLAQNVWFRRRASKKSVNEPFSKTITADWDSAPGVRVMEEIFPLKERKKTKGKGGREGERRQRSLAEKREPTLSHLRCIHVPARAVRIR